MSEAKASVNLLAENPENGADPVLRARRSPGGGAVVLCLSLLLVVGVVAMVTYCTVQGIRNESRVRLLELEIERLRRQMAAPSESGMAYNRNEYRFGTDDVYALDVDTDDVYTDSDDVYSDNDGGDDDKFPDGDGISGDYSDEMVADEKDFLFDDKQSHLGGATRSRNKRSARRKGKRNWKRNENRKENRNGKGKRDRKSKNKRSKKAGKDQSKEKLEKYIEDKIMRASGMAAIHLEGALTHNTDVMARLRSSAGEYQEYPELDGRLYQQGFVTNREVMAFWKQATWSNNERSNVVYNFNKTEGSVTVKQDGVYFIYAQVHFHDTAACLGYAIQKHNNNNNNNTVVFSCYTSIDPLPDEENIRHGRVKDAIPASSPAHQRSYSRYEACNVNGLISLASGDVISLRMNNKHFRIAASRQLTFWGMFRVASGAI